MVADTDETGVVSIWSPTGAVEEKEDMKQKSKGEKEQDERAKEKKKEEELLQPNLKPPPKLVRLSLPTLTSC